MLDAGCGFGRNAEYFIRNNYQIYGVDAKEEAVLQLQEKITAWNPDFPKGNFTVEDIRATGFSDGYFDFIISSAVLHFAESHADFTAMFREHIRVLKPGGFFFCRMTARHTIEQLATPLGEGVYLLPDESVRYLLDQALLKELMARHELVFVEPFKTVNVADIRTMATLVLMKQQGSNPASATFDR